jgi:hypothetical protein
MKFHIEMKSESSLWWAPMAWGIFWGLLFNTLLVLVVVPTFYYAWERRKEKWGWGIDRGHEEEAAKPVPAGH